MQPPGSSQLSDADRGALLDAEIDRYIARGYFVASRTTTAVQLVKPKAFNLGCALLGFLFLFAGLLLYVLLNVAERDTRLYLSVDEHGVIHRQSFGELGYRVLCAQCGHANPPTRAYCKRCRAPPVVSMTMDQAVSRGQSRATWARAGPGAVRTTPGWS